MIPQLLRQRDPIEEELLQQLMMRYRTGGQGTLPPSSPMDPGTASQGWSLSMPQGGGDPRMLFGAGTQSPEAATPIPPMSPHWKIQRQRDVNAQEAQRSARAAMDRQGATMKRKFGIAPPQEETPAPIGPPAITEPGITELPRLRRERPKYEDDVPLSDVSERLDATAPAEAKGEAEQRASRINNLNMLKGIAEGAGRVGDAFVEYGDRMARRPVQKARDYTGGIDEALAREEDKIPQSLKEKLKAAGYDLPEGTTFSQFEKFAPAMTASNRNQALTRSSSFARAKEAGIQGRFDTKENRLTTDQTDRQGRERAAIGDNFDRMNRVKIARTQIDAAKAALAGLEANEMGAFAASIKAARASGEVGALTESDKAPFQQRQAYWQQIYDWAVRRGTGAMSEGVKEQLRGVLKSYTDAAESAIDQAATEYSQRHEGRFGMSSDRIKSDVLQVHGDGTIMIRSSAGTEKPILREDLDAAREIDPGLEVIGE